MALNRRVDTTVLVFGFRDISSAFITYTLLPWSANLPQDLKLKGQTMMDQNQPKLQTNYFLGIYYICWKLTNIANNHTYLSFEDQGEVCFFFFKCVLCIHMCTCLFMHTIKGGFRVQSIRSPSESLKIGARIQTLVFCKSSMCSWPLSHLSGSHGWSFKIMNCGFVPQISNNRTALKQLFKRSSCRHCLWDTLIWGEA